MDLKVTAATRSVVLTGASRGVGFATAVALLRQDPTLHVVLALRDDPLSTDGQSALAHRLIQATGNPHVSTVECDLASLTSVRSAVERLSRALTTRAIPVLHGIIANAGVQLVGAHTTTVDGFELTFGVNVLGHYLLLRQLMSQLVPPARVVLVTSSTHWGNFRHNFGVLPAPHWSGLDAMAYPTTGGPADHHVRSGYHAYTVSKLALIYLTHQFARLAPAGVDVYSFHPGMVPGTGIARHASTPIRWLWRTVVPLLRFLPAVNSATSAGEKLAKVITGPTPADSGGYLNLGKPERSSPESYSPEREQELWRGLDELAGMSSG